MKLDLACGFIPAPGFDGVDIVPLGQLHVVDLQKFPWPFGSESAEALRSAHYIEHLPAREVQYRDLHATNYNQRDGARFVGKDFFFAFFDEAHRILKPGGQFEVICPAGTHRSAFQDPTHRRYIMIETFSYLDKAWREAARVSHYNVSCDFEVSAGALLGEKPPETETEEERVLRGRRDWNVYAEWRVILVKK